MKEIKIKLPMSAVDLESLLHKVCDNGHWDECVVVCDENQVTDTAAALSVARNDIEKLQAKIVDLTETIVDLKERIHQIGGTL